MILYQELSLMNQVVYGISIMVLAVTAVFLFLAACVLHIGRLYQFFTGILTVCIMYMFQGIADVSYNLQNGQALTFCSGVIGKLPCIVVAVLMAIIACIEVVFMAVLHHRKKNILTSGAIKESLDALPDGVCFFDEDGQPLLVNIQMQKISGELFGTEILNAERFLYDLKNTKSTGDTDILGIQPSVIAGTEDGKVWDFRRERLQLRNSGIQELIAYDVTEQYRLSRELKDRNESLSRINERLRLYGREVERVTREKEILTAKIHVHDDVGRSLLAVRSYLTQPVEKRDRRELLLLWHHTVAVLKNEAVPVSHTDDWKLLLKAAEAVDVKIVKNGRLPADKKMQEVIIAALHECLTNTVKHAKGNRLYLDIHSGEEALTAKITNNGKQPSGEIKETGGLKNLRHIVESAGAEMTVESMPRFLLKVKFLKGEEKDGKDKSDDCG